jgi:fermentation-respiration switch protein FrsA (DUF1100 family)
MKRALRRAGIALGALVLAAGLARTPIERRCVFPGCDEAFPPREALARAVPGARVVDYGAEVRLRGLWAPSEVNSNTVALYFHGNADSAAQNIGAAAALSRAGTSVFLAEFRGYGGLSGAPSEPGFYADGLAAIEALRGLGVDAKRLVIVGRSLGSGVAVEIAARGNGRGLVLISPFTSVTDVAWHFTGPLAWVFVVDRFDSISKLDRVRGPIVVLHGTADRTIPFEQGKRLAEGAGARGTLIPLEGVGHDDIDVAAVVSRGLAAIR